MRHLIFIYTLAILVMWNLACVKKTIDTDDTVVEIDTTETPQILGIASTPQVNYRIWYRTSNSIDNALINSEIRTHIIFNQAKIKSQKLTPTGGKGISYNRVIMYPFIMEITFDNDSIGVWGVYTNSKVAFTHIPNKINNLLKDNHPARMVTFKGNNEQKATKNVWRNQDFKLRCMDVYYDDKLVMSDYYMPLDRLSNTVDFKHKF